MARYQIEVRKGGNGPAEWGGVVVLIVLVVFAAAGHHEITAMLHDIEAIAITAACGAVALAVLALAVRAGIRRHRAARRYTREQARITAAHARYIESVAARRAVGAPPLAWPLPGEWDETRRHDGYRR